MRTDFRIATITGTVVLLALVGSAMGAQQEPASSQASEVALTKPNSLAADVPAEPNASASVASSILTESPAFSPAAATRKAWDCLANGLAEKNYDRRSQAIVALGTIGLEQKAVSLIEDGLKDKDVEVRQASAEVLGIMKSRGSISKLQVALDDNAAVVRFAAAQALWAMEDRSGQDLFLEVLGGERKVSTGMVRGGLQHAHEEMHDPKALAELGSEQAAGFFLGPAGYGVTAAINLSKDKAAPARAISARLLAEDPSADAREVLREALQDKSWIVRAAATEALGAHGSVSDVKILAPLLDDQEKRVRYRAAAAIIRVSSRRAS
jgi:HEAT repeat protein